MNGEMNILIIGSGGRESAFAWKCKQSPGCKELYIAPGNAGTSAYGTNLEIEVLDFQAIKDAVLSHKIDLIIVGPEAPLVNGLYDYFKNDKEINDILFIGPSREGAQLEGSKAYAKLFMYENEIPTAGYGEYTMENLQDGINHIESTTGPYVLKADGLAAGKGVLIMKDKQEAKAELKRMLEGKFGEASRKVVIEDFLDGLEFSVFVLTDGHNYVIFPEAKDYKRIGEGDTGLNTGGMGAVSPVSFYDKNLAKKVEERIIKPTIAGLRKRQIAYTGFIFIGLIRVDNEPYVIEYNVRMGDPETEVVLPRLKSDFVDVLSHAAKGTLDKVDLEILDQFAATIMTVSGGYPESYQKGKVISNLEKISEGIVFHAGTKLAENGDIITNGGRVIAMTACGDTMEEALITSKNNAEKVQFEGKYFRKDIGFDLK